MRTFLLRSGFAALTGKLNFLVSCIESDAHTGIFYNYFIRIVGARVRYGAVPQRWKVQTFTQHMHEIVVAVLD